MWVGNHSVPIQGLQFSDWKSWQQRGQAQRMTEALWVLIHPQKHWMSEARPCLPTCLSFLKESFFEMNLNVCNPRGMIFCIYVASSKWEDPKFPSSKLFQLKCYLYISLLLEIMAVCDYLVNSHFWNIWK